MALRRAGAFLYEHTWVAGKTAAVETFRDYRDVFIQMAKNTRDYPIATFSKVIPTVGLGYLAWTAPERRDYVGRLVAAEDDFIECGGAFNRSAYDFVQHRLHLEGEGRLGYMFLGPISIMYEQRCADQVALFDSTYASRRERLQWIRDHVLDVGYYGQWRWLKEALVDYDIEDDE